MANKAGLLKIAFGGEPTQLCQKSGTQGEVTKPKAC